MKNRFLVASLILMLSNSISFANPASQSWVKSWVTDNFAPLVGAATQNWVSTYFALLDPANINWSSLCPNGQSLTNSAGCAPNCNSGSAVSVCTQIFRTGQVAQMAGIASPYLDNGIVVFKLIQTGGAGTGASFNVVLQPTPNGYGYMCEILNSNATPAILWNVQQSPPFPTTVITMDSSVNPNNQIISSNFVSTVTQPAGVVNYWYSNPSNPLYMMCLGYSVTNVNQLSSNAACGGSGNACVTYTLQ